MSERTNLVQVAMAETALRSSLRGISISTRVEARHWVRFACQCVRRTPGAGAGPHPSLLPELDVWRDAFNLAEQWSSGGDVPGDELSSALRWISRDSPTLSVAMSGAAAAQWAVLSAVEASVRAANFADDAREADRIVELVENAARYARQARGGNSLAPITFQAELRDRFLQAP